MSEEPGADGTIALVGLPGSGKTAVGRGLALSCSAGRSWISTSWWSSAPAAPRRRGWTPSRSRTSARWNRAALARDAAGRAVARVRLVMRGDRDRRRVRDRSAQPLGAGGSRHDRLAGRGRRDAAPAPAREHGGQAAAAAPERFRHRAGGAPCGARAVLPRRGHPRRRDSAGGPGGRVAGAGAGGHEAGHRGPPPLRRDRRAQPSQRPGPRPRGDGPRPGRRHAARCARLGGDRRSARGRGRAGGRGAARVPRRASRDAGTRHPCLGEGQAACAPRSGCWRRPRRWAWSAATRGSRSAAARPAISSRPPLRSTTGERRWSRSPPRGWPRRIRRSAARWPWTWHVPRTRPGPSGRRWRWSRTWRRCGRSRGRGSSTAWPSR